MNNNFMAISKPEEFFNSVEKLKSLNALSKKIKAEKEYLESKYNTVASLKNGFTVYRNYLKANIDTNKIISKKPLLRLLLEEFRLNERQQAIFNTNKHEDIKSNKSELREVYNLKEYLQVATQLLSSSSYLDNVIGLCAMTGRRAAEIGSTANFKYVDNQTVQFTGQLKTKTRINVMPYLIPVLYDSTKLIESLNSIRQLKPKYIGNPDLFHSSTSKDLSKKIKKHFEGVFEGIPRVKDLRAIYALICFTEFHKNPVNRKIDRDVYFSRILGHSENDITTCGSYVDFYLSDY